MSEPAHATATPAAPVPSGQTPAAAPLRRAPFLVWPVARREFYASIGLALMLPLAWGILILGWRALVVVLAPLIGALAIHILLRRFTRRGRSLLLWHTVLSALMIAALALPQWPPMVLAAGGALVVVFIWLWGGPGQERVHSSLLIAVLLPVLLARATNDDTVRSAIVAKDRLFMGDVLAEPADSNTQWPLSREIAGHDAVRRDYPHAVVSVLLRSIAQIVSAERHEPAKPPTTRPAAASTPAATAPLLAALPPTPTSALMDDALVNRLPSMEMLLLGIFPGRIGTISALGILLGGLYLAYRNILRPHSVALFLFSALTGFVLITLSARLGVLGGVGLTTINSLDSIQTYLTLICYEFFSGDVLLATVFILAMPGTEPITPRGRRWFLITAGICAAAVQRLTPAIPACTLVLLGLQPLTGFFDYMMARKSWLNYGPRV